MPRYLPVLIGVVAVVGAAYDHGRLTDRWGRPADLDAAVARMQMLPTQLGDWKSEEIEIKTRELEVAQVAGHLARKYTNPKTGREVQILLLCGRPGPVGAHTPEVCYASAGYEQGGISEHFRTSEGDDFWSGRFARPGGKEPLRILWAWSTGSMWSAPDNPRRAFGNGAIALYKLYVIRPIKPSDSNLPEDPTAEFVRVLLPKLRDCLAVPQERKQG